MADTPAPTAVVRRVLPAAPDVVYDEWLDPDALADWMCRRTAPDRHRGRRSGVLGQRQVPGAGPAAATELQLELFHLAGSEPAERGERAPGTARERPDAHDDRAHAAAARARRSAPARLGSHRGPARRGTGRGGRRAPTLIARRLV